MPLFGPNIKKMKENRDIEGLMREMKNKEAKVRIEATRALVELRHVNGLTEALRDDVPEVRAEAIAGLETTGGSDATVAIVDFLATESADALWQRALEVLNRVSKRDERIWLNIAVESLKKERYERALVCFKKAVEINSNKETLGSIGVALLDHGRYDDALKYFERFIDTDSNDARGLGGKGVALYKLGQYEEATSCCRKALEMDPGLKGARDTLGAIYYEKGDDEAMFSLARETLRFAPEDIKARIMLSEALVLSGKLVDAELEMKEALEFLNQTECLAPEDLSMVHQQLGIIHAMRGHGDRAISEFEKAAQVSPRDEWACALLDSYLILDTVGGALEGSPSERRARLLAVTEKRCVKGYTTYQEKIVGEARPDKIGNFMDDAWKDPAVMDAVLKFWDRSQVAAAAREFGQAFVGNYIKAIKELDFSFSKVA